MIRTRPQDFIILLSKMTTVEILGIAKILCANALPHDKEATPEELTIQLVDKMLDNYNKLNRRGKRELMRVMHAAVEGKDEPTTEDTEPQQ